MKIARGLILFAAAGMLAGCATKNGLPTTIEGGECQAFERPPYAVQGRTQYDQRVADGFVETGVAACGWQRPAARPPEIEARPAVRPVAKSIPAKRPGIFKRLRQRATPAAYAPSMPAAAPVAIYPTPTPAVPVEAPKPVPVDPPRSRLDDLLRPIPEPRRVL